MNARLFPRIVVAILIIMGLSSQTAAATASSQEPSGGVVSARIRALTGSPTRLVWCQYAKGSGKDRFAQGQTTRLCGFDTEDVAGERVILGNRASYAKPMFTPDGKKVIYSDRTNKKVYVVNWDGSQRRSLCRGYASDAWRDPVTDLVWVYVRSGEGRSKDPIWRHRLDEPEVSELVWSSTHTGHSLVPWFHLSADGKRAGGAFPWQNCGVADLTTKTWKQYGSGCWTSIAPDNSYRFFSFNSGHKTIAMFDAGGRNKRNVAINGGDHIKNSAVYSPRWSNHPRFITMTGPGGHRAEAKGEIHLAMFNSDFSVIEKHVRVTYNDRGDLYGDAWIKPSGRPVAPAKSVAAPPPEPVKLTDKWPGSTDALIFVWENSSQANEIRDATGKTLGQCLGRMRGAGKFGRHYEMQLTGGAFLVQDADGALLKACKKSNELTIEATIRTDNLEQTGPARIISFSSDTRSRNFTLGQDRDKLILRLRTPRTGSNGSKPQHMLSRLEAHRTYHVIVTYRPGCLICYLDGKAVFSSDDAWGDFSNWERHHLLFGDEYSGARDWSGRLEGIALYSRFMDEKEVKHHRLLYASKLKQRKAVSRLVVDAKLLAMTPTPDPKRLAPYRRCLAEYLYEIVKNDGGVVREKRIIVAHWVILDTEVLKSNRKIGQTYRLGLESFDAHPQLQSERSVSDIGEYALRLFYDVGP